MLLALLFDVLHARSRPRFGSGRILSSSNTFSNVLLGSPAGVFVRIHARPLLSVHLLGRHGLLLVLLVGGKGLWIPEHLLGDLPADLASRRRDVLDVVVQEEAGAHGHALVDGLALVAHAVDHALDLLDALGLFAVLR